MLRKDSTMAETADSDLVERMGLAVRRMGAQSVLSSAGIAKHFGLHTTDLEVLDLIFVRETATAGELAKATGLTSGSVTALIDRLVQKGYLTRCEDPDDRRRTLVRINRRETAPIEAVFAPRQAAMFALWSRYSAKELEVVIDFLTQSTNLLARCAQELETRKHSAKDPLRGKGTRRTAATAT
jgi:DNA-binding MarR family transcriptional regulator